MNAVDKHGEADITIRLCDLSSGARAMIVSVGGDPVFQNRLRAMGLREGEEIEVVKQAPLADPMEYRIGSMHLSLRRDEAEFISVTRN